MPKRTPIKKEEVKKKRTPVKLGKDQKADNVVLTTEEQRIIKDFEPIAVEVLANLEQLQAKVKADIKTVKKASRPIHFFRAFNALNGSPHLVYCKEGRCWQSILFCEYVCNSQCTRYRSGRYICTMFRCDSEKKRTCNITNSTCSAFRIYQTFPKQYIQAYAPVYKMKEELLGAIKRKTRKRRRKRRK